MDAKIQLLSEDRARLQTFEKQHQTLQYENDRLKTVEQNNLALQTRIEVLQEVEKKLKEAFEKITVLETTSSMLSDENKQIAVLKEENTSLSSTCRELEVLREEQKKMVKLFEKEAIVFQEKISHLEGEVNEKLAMGKQLKSLETEHQSMKKTIEDYHNANANKEVSQQNLMKEIEELRKVEAQHRSLRQTHETLQTEAQKVEVELKSCKTELEEVKEISHAREKQVLKLKKESLEKAESQKVEGERLQQAQCAVQESTQKYEVLVKHLADQKKEAENVAHQLIETTTNVRRLEQELVEVRSARDKERLEAQSQQQKLTELREMEINYKIMLSENSALKSVSENLKNLSFAYEKSEQKCQSLRDENVRLDQVRIENTELKCQAKSFEVELKDGITKREKMASEILELKAQMENVRTQSGIEVTRKCNEMENEKTSLIADFESKLLEAKTETMKKCSEIENEKTTLKAGFETKLLEMTTEKESLQQSVNELTKLKEDMILKEKELVTELETLKEVQKNSADVSDTRKNDEENDSTDEKMKEMELFHLSQIEERDTKIDLLVEELDHLRNEHGIIISSYTLFLFFHFF